MSNNSLFITELKNNTENVNYDQTTSISIVKFKESLVFFIRTVIFQDQQFENS